MSLQRVFFSKMARAGVCVSRHITYINSFNLPNSHVRWMISLSQFFRRETALELFSEVTQLLSGRAESKSRPMETRLPYMLQTYYRQDGKYREKRKRNIVALQRFSLLNIVMYFLPIYSVHTIFNKWSISVILCTNLDIAFST